MSVVAGAASQMAGNVASVAEGTDHLSTSVQSVAGAIKEMSASLGEYRREGAGGAERRGPEAEPTKEER